MAPYNVAHKFKADRNPSAGARVNKDNSVIWNCFTCKNTGPLAKLYTFLEKKQNRSYAQEIAQLDRADELPDFELMYCETFEEEKPEPLAVTNVYEDIYSYPIAEKYLVDRGISQVTARKLGLQYNPEDPRIVFPVKSRDGQVYGFTSRTIIDAKPKIKNYYGFQKEFFILGMEHWQDRPTIIVEGLFAYAHFHEITKGRLFPFDIGAIMGSEISQEQLLILINHGRACYPFLDPDNAGKTGMFGKPVQKDWSDEKKSMERMKGMVHALKSHIPVLVPKWELDDPDKLTYDQLFDMIQKSRMAF